MSVREYRHIVNGLFLEAFESFPFGKKISLILNCPL
jgi:hypothetical protein